MHSGEAYGAQAVLSAAAHQKATGTAVTAYDWSSKDQAARILRELGFRVLAGDDPEAVVPVTGEWRETSDVGPDVIEVVLHEERPVVEVVDVSVVPVERVRVIREARTVQVPVSAKVGREEVDIVTDFGKGAVAGPGTTVAPGGTPDR